MTLTLLTIILLVCVLLEGFFSGSEMAVVNADKASLRAAAESGSKWARIARGLADHPARFFSATLLGTNICTVTGSVVFTLYIIENYGEEYTAFAILFWPVTLIFGELVPKSLYQYYADKMVLVVSPALILFSFVLYPIIWPLSKLTDLILQSHVVDCLVPV